MPTPIAEFLFWAAAAVIVVAQFFILRSTRRGMKIGPAGIRLGARVGVRRSLPAICLVGLLVWTWHTMHAGTFNFDAQSSGRRGRARDRRRGAAVAPTEHTLRVRPARAHQAADHLAAARHDRRADVRRGHAVVVGGDLGDDRRLSDGRRRERGEHVSRQRHRRRDGAHEAAADSERPHDAARGDRVRHPDRDAPRRTCSRIS